MEARLGWILSQHQRLVLRDLVEPRPYFVAAAEALGQPQVLAMVSRLGREQRPVLRRQRGIDRGSTSANSPKRCNCALRSPRRPAASRACAADLRIARCRRPA
jgi:hypothetical protein